MKLSNKQRIVILIWAVTLILATTWTVRWEDRRALNETVIRTAYEQELSGGDTTNRVTFVFYGHDTVRVPVMVLRSMAIAGLKRENEELKRALRSEGKEPLLQQIRLLRADTTQKQKYIIALINAK